MKNELSGCTFNFNPDSKVHGANMGPSWDLLAPDGPHVIPMNLDIWEPFQRLDVVYFYIKWTPTVCLPSDSVQREDVIGLEHLHDLIHFLKQNQAIPYYVHIYTLRWFILILLIIYSLFAAHLL